MALGSIAKQEPVSSGASLQSNVAFDNSGWAVSIGPGAATSTKTAMPGAAQSMQTVAAGVGGLLGNPVVLIAVGVALFLYLKHK